MPETAEATTETQETQDGQTQNPETPQAKQANQGTEEAAVNEESSGESQETESPLWDGIAEDHPVRAEVERLRRENASRRTAAQQTKQENEELQSKLAEAKTAEEVSELVNEWQSKVDAKEHELLRERVARQERVPEGFFEFLTADDEEGLVAQAKKLKPLAAQSAPPSEPRGGKTPTADPLNGSTVADAIRKNRRH